MLAQFTNIKPFDKFEVKRSLLDDLGDKLNLLDVHKYSAHSVWVLCLERLAHTSKAQHDFIKV